MQTRLTRFPDLSILTNGMASVLSSKGAADGGVTVLDRRPNIYESTYSSEIVTCRLAGGREIRFFCKYAGRGVRTAFGHRAGVSSEAAVYRHLLQPLQVSVPAFYGAPTVPLTGWSWLVLEYLDRSVAVSKAQDPGAMREAARWIGQFHAANRVRISEAALSFLNRYDAPYYGGWVRRTARFAGPLHRRFPWLTVLCDGAERFMESLFQGPVTVIHGEYYPKNILFRDGLIYPIDWESAAIAAGEVDLASLTERWPSGIVRQCELEYQRVCWPAGPPPDFERSLAAARLYLHFRWLGDRPAWTMRESWLWRFEQMRCLGEQWGLI